MKEDNFAMKLPDDPSWWTSVERRKNKWTGVCENGMTGDMEFWIVGELKKTVSALARSVDPNAMNKAHLEVFHMNGNRADPF